MAYDIGPKIGIEGEKEFRDAIASINTKLKTLGTEMKAVTASYDKNDTSVEKLTAQQKVLTAQIDAQMQKLLGMRQGLDQAKQKYGENSDVTQKWQQQVNRAAAELHSLEYELRDNNSALDTAKRNSSEYAKAQEEAARAAEQLERAQKEAADSIAQASSKLAESKQAMDAVNKAALAVTAAVAGIAGAATKVGMDFEAQMSKVESISGASADEVQALKDAAQEMGATTKFSATESAQALEYMAMAGWKSQQMIDGLPGIMNLAAASGEDLASVSDIVTDALTAFGLQASDSAHFADVLAKASSSSNTNVALMGATFKYAAPVAGALGYNIEDTAVAIGLMANAGIKGEMAGTALRGMLTNLAKPSDQVAQYMDDLGLSLTDTSGNVKPLNKLLQEMRQKFSKLTDAQKAEYAAGIAGKEAMSGLLAIVNSGDSDFDSLTKAIQESDGTSKKMADTMNKNLKGQLVLLGSAAESAGIAMYDKFAEPAADAVGELADKVATFANDLASGALDDNIMAIGAAAATAGIAIVGFNAALVVEDVANFANAVSMGGEALEGFTANTKAGAIAQGALNLVQSLSPMGALAIATTAVVGGLALYHRWNIDAHSSTEKLSDSINENAKAIDEERKARDELNASRDAALNESMTELGHVQTMITELGTLKDKTGKVKDGEEDRARALSDQINQVLPGAVTWTEKQGEAYATVADNIDLLLQKEMLKRQYDVNQEGVDAAIQKQQEYAGKLTEIEKSKAEATRLYEEQRQQLIRLTTDEYGNQIAAATGAVEDTQRQMDFYKQQLDDLGSQYQQYGDLYSECTQAIEDQDQWYAAILSGDQEQIQQALQITGATLKDYTGKNSEELKKQEEDAHSNYQTLLDLKASGAKVSQADIDEKYRIWMEAMKIASQAGVDTELNYAGGILSGQDEVKSAAETVSGRGVEELDAAAGKAEVSGTWFTKGFASGIEKVADIVSKSGVLLGSTAVGALQKSIKQGSPSRVTMESGMWFDVGFAKGIEDNSGKAEDAAAKMSEKVLKAANEWVSDQKFYKRLAAKEEVEFWTKMKSVSGLAAKELAEIDKKLYTARSDASKAAFDESKAWIENEKYYNRMSAEEEVAAWERVVSRKNLLVSEQAEAERQLYSAQQSLISEQQKALDEYSNSIESRVQSLQSFAGLFDKVEQDSKVTGKELLVNLKGQVDAFKGWQDDMDTLAKKGVTGALLEELSNLGPSAADEIHALSTLTETELQEYADLFAEKADLIEQQAKVDIPPVDIPVTVNADDPKTQAAALTAGASIIAVMQTAMIGKLPLATQAGAKSVDAVASGVQTQSYVAEQESAKMADQCNKAVDSYYTQFRWTGERLMDGVAQGVSDGKSGVVNAVKWALEAAAQAARDAMDINSPSKVFAEIGDYMGQGIGVGFVSRMRSVAREITDSIPVPVVESPNAAAMRIGEGVVNGVAAAMQGGTAQQSTIITKVYLNDREIAEAVYDPLQQVSMRRGDT